jgi:hypothetical protein
MDQRRTISSVYIMSSCYKHMSFRLRLFLPIYNKFGVALLLLCQCAKFPIFELKRRRSDAMAPCLVDVTGYFTGCDSANTTCNVLSQLIRKQMTVRGACTRYIARLPRTYCKPRKG